MLLCRVCMVGTACWFLVGLTSAQIAECARESCSIRIVDVVRNPQAYQGKRIRVQGVLDLRFEGHSIREGETRLALNLFRPIVHDVSKAAVARMEAQVDEDWRRIETWRRSGLQGEWVEVIGIFDPNETGHMGMIKSGGLRDVVTIAPKLQPTR